VLERILPVVEGASRANILIQRRIKSPRRSIIITNPPPVMQTAVAPWIEHQHMNEYSRCGMTIPRICVRIWHSLIGIQREIYHWSWPKELPLVLLVVLVVIIYRLCIMSMVVIE
jgi:hypothetical protein